MSVQGKKEGNKERTKERTKERKKRVKVGRMEGDSEEER